MLVDKCDKLQKELKEKEHRINKLTSDVKCEQTRVQQLKQHAEESGMLEDELMLPTQEQQTLHRDKFVG